MSEYKNNNNIGQPLKEATPKIFIFAGTVEGRNLGEVLSQTRALVSLSVAGAYGKETLQHLQGLPGVTIYSQRLKQAEMAELFQKTPFDLVIDATHPYAKEVTENCRLACKQTATSYRRLLRKGLIAGDDRFVTVPDIQGAVAYLEGVEGKALITTGSKELAAFSRLTEFRNRLFVRVLPDSEVIAHCKTLGFDAKQLIAMQGPFSQELNQALLQQLACRYLVTKNTGWAGGLPEKLAAAQAVGVRVILIAPPVEEEGLSYEQMLDFLATTFGLQCKNQVQQDKPTLNPKAYFPLFVPSEGKRVLVVGGGTIATRRVKALLQFRFRVLVVAPQICEKIRDLAKNSALQLVERAFVAEDLAGCSLAVAVADSRAVNQQVGALAQAAGVPVSVGDNKAECSFYFPGVAITKDLVFGVTAEGKDHGLVKEAVQKIKEVWQIED